MEIFTSTETIVNLLLDIDTGLEVGIVYCDIFRIMLHIFF